MKQELYWLIGFLSGCVAGSIVVYFILHLLIS